SDHVDAAAGAAPAGEGGHGGGSVGVEVGRAHREHVGVGGRVRQGPVEGAVVASGDDHHDPVAPGVLDRGGQGVELVGLQAVGAEGEVEDADVEAGVVAMLVDPVDGRDHL